MLTSTMEEQECEVIFVSKESPNEKNILEALAEYKMKNQPEQQHHMIGTKAGPSESVTVNHSTLSVKPEVSNQTPNDKKEKMIGVEKQSSIQAIETLKSQPTKILKSQRMRLKLLQNYLSNSERKEGLKNDFEVGITEYVSERQGFSAVMKLLSSDFQAHEITLDGSVVHLTKEKNLDLSSLCQPYPTDEGKLEKASDKLNRMNDMSKADNREIFKMQDERQNGSINYIQFVLWIRNMTAKTAIGIIARKLGKIPACFMIAENKIAGRSITCQLATVKQDNDLRLLNSIQFPKKICIGNFSFASKPLQQGDLKGNHFIIALRNVIGDECHIEANLKSLEDFGFINYYDSQEFGSTREVPKHLIGKQLILKRWQEAIDLILEPRFIDECPSPISLACLEYKSSRDIHKALGMLTDMAIQTNVLPVQLLSSIKKNHGENLAALNDVPFDLRLPYIRAYQSFIWNKIVSKRLAKFGAKLIVGDLVYATGNNDQNNNDLFVKMEGNNDRLISKVHCNRKEVIFIDKNNIHKFTIYDVVLPLPQHDAIYPANEVANWYKDLLMEDGVSEQDFNSNSKTYCLDESYRRMMLRPSDLKWKFIHYDNPDQRLISSDLDRLQEIELPPVALQGGAYLGLVLEFSLPAFAFAAMALREILKMDITADTRNSFEVDQLKSNSERKLKVCKKKKICLALATSALSQTVPPLTKIEEPANKKIKGDPDTELNEEEVTVIESPQVSKFKSIIYIDIASDLED